MLSTSAASAKAFPIKQYNQLYVAIAVFTDGVCGHEYPAKCVEVLGPGNDLARNADGKPKAKKKRPALSDAGKPKMSKKDSTYYGNILKAKADCGASDDELPFPNRSRNSSIDHALKVIIDTMSLYYKRPTIQIGSKTIVSGQRDFQGKDFAKGFDEFQNKEKRNYMYCGTFLKTSSIQMVYVIPSLLTWKCNLTSNIRMGINRQP